MEEIDDSGCTCNNEKGNWIRNKTTNFEYVNPVPGNIPIFVSPIQKNGVWVKESLEKDLSLVKESGANLATSGALGYSVLNECLSIASKVGVNLIINNASYFQCNNDKGELNNSIFRGYKLIDEPNYSDLVADYTYDCKTIIDKYYNIMDKNPTLIVYINLVGATGTQTEGKTLEQYLDAYQNNFKPSFFSYDFYPISETSNLIFEGIDGYVKKYPEGEVKIEYDHFFETLRLFQEKSEKVNRPFWTFCESASYMGLYNHHYRPIATENHLRFEAFSALAHGAKGIQYFTFNMKENANNESFISAFVDRKGNKTPVFYFAQKINNEINRYQDIFLNADKPKVNFVNTDPLSVFGGSLIVINFPTNSKGILCSELISKNEKYLMLVNVDVLNNASPAVSIISGAIRKVTPISSTLFDNNYYSNRSMGINLLPGGYCILHLRQ